MSNTSAESEIIICRCEEVTQGEILAAIEDGATTLKGVKIRTEAGMGLCQGRTCRRLISQMLAKNRPAAGIYPPTLRPPVRAAKVSEYTGGEAGE
ncbi:MAG: (2Fe-2S)-binding protein [Spirochaetales bacterium]|jgi:NAD(P)H-nitrite reductase large subunit|nr:(2Fe-2S)-binding protein [Spirochaetales bacterium]